MCHTFSWYKTLYDVLLLSYVKLQGANFRFSNFVIFLFFSEKLRIKITIWVERKNNHPI